MRALTFAWVIVQGYDAKGASIGRRAFENVTQSSALRRAEKLWAHTYAEIVVVGTVERGATECVWRNELGLNYMPSNGGAK